MPYGVPDSEYGFIRQYVEEMPEDLRPSVAPILNQQRREADANFNKRFEETNTELEQWREFGQQAGPAAEVMAEILNPETSEERLTWLVDQLEDSYGVEGIKDALRGHLAGEPEQEPEQEQPMGTEDLDEYFDKKIEEVSQRWEQEQADAERAEASREATNKLIRERAQEKGAELDDNQVDYVLFRSYDAVQKAQDAGQKFDAGEVLNEVVDEFVTSIKPARPENGNLPNLATGNGASGAVAPLPEDLDMNKREDRLAKMLHIYETEKER